MRSLGFVAGNLHKSACYSFSLDFFLKKKKKKKKKKGGGGITRLVESFEEELRVASLLPSFLLR